MQTMIHHIIRTIRSYIDIEDMTLLSRLIRTELEVSRVSRSSQVAIPSIRNAVQDRVLNSMKITVGSFKRTIMKLKGLARSEGQLVFNPFESLDDGCHPIIGLSNHREDIDGRSTLVIDESGIDMIVTISVDHNGGVRDTQRIHRVNDNFWIGEWTYEESQYDGSYHQVDGESIYVFRYQLDDGDHEVINITVDDYDNDKPLYAVRSNRNHDIWAYHLEEVILGDIPSNMRDAIKDAIKAAMRIQQEKHNAN